VPKISPRIHAKYQNLEKRGVLYIHKRPNSGFEIPYTRFLKNLPVYRILKNPGRTWVKKFSKFGYASSRLSSFGNSKTYCFIRHEIFLEIQAGIFGECALHLQI